MQGLLHRLRPAPSTVAGDADVEANGVNGVTSGGDGDNAKSGTADSPREACGKLNATRVNGVFRPPHARRSSFTKQFISNVKPKVSGVFNALDEELIVKRKRGFLNALRRVHKVVRYVVEDWLFLALLGIIMALLSMAMDLTIEALQTWHVRTINYVNVHTHDFWNIATTYGVWVVYAVVLVESSALFVRLVAPQAIGSGIPEMKTILRGVILKEYLTFRTLISKMVGLTLALGTGLPIGKEGPFVHVASVVANLLSTLVHSFTGIYENESRSSEMLAAACAVGVSSTFSAPVGGVLFSIEVTSVYFAVRNYWRGFFAASCSATLFRVLRVMLTETEVTVVAFYQTAFPRESFFPEELGLFMILGAICGFLSAAFIFTQRSLVLMLRRAKWAKAIFQKHWIIYPLVISFAVASITYPKGFGQFLGGHTRFSQAAKDFFLNCTWTGSANSSNGCSREVVEVWMGPGANYSVFASLGCFAFTYFFLTVLSSTLPIPSGIFGPSFVLGAAIGRAMGELMACWYPEGLKGANDVQIHPGIYAVVGAAAFTGGVTHTVSVAVIVLELTGQLICILPVMIAVLVANAVCSYLVPSIYDSIIQIKHLPYLPDIPQSSSSFHGIRVEQFMRPDVLYLSRESTYSDVEELLAESLHLKAYPVVDNRRNRILIGSCSRARLLRSLEAQTCTEARKQEASARVRKAIESADQQLQDGATAPPPTDAHEQQPAAEAPLAVRTVDRFRVQSIRGPTPVNTPAADANQLKPHPFMRRNGLSAGCLTSIMARELDATGDETMGRESNSTTTTSKLGSRLSPRRRSLASRHSANSHDVYATIGGMIRSLTRFSPVAAFARSRNKPQDHDLYGDERRHWENQQLAVVVDFDQLGIDPAPFQLVTHVSLFKVHSIFSLLGLNRAYVCQCGRLVGVVALKDLRLAVEKAQSGELSANSPPLYVREDGGVREDCGGEGEAERRLSRITLPRPMAEYQEEEDSKNDVLNPRLEVVSRQSTMYGGDFDINGYRERRAQKPPSVVLKGVSRWRLLRSGGSLAAATAAAAGPAGLGTQVSAVNTEKLRESRVSPAHGEALANFYYPSAPNLPTKPVEKRVKSPPTIVLPVITINDDDGETSSHSTRQHN